MDWASTLPRRSLRRFCLHKLRPTTESGRAQQEEVFSALTKRAQSRREGKKREICRQQRLDAATWRGSSSSAVHKTAALKNRDSRHRSPGSRLQLRCRPNISNVTTTMVRTTTTIGAEEVGILSSRRVKLLPRRTC